MATVRNRRDDEPHELSREEGWALLDAAAHRHLGMTADDFIRAWDSGVFHDPDPDLHPGVMRVAFLLGLVREEGMIPAFTRAQPK
jgi:hypothetical protein